MVSCVHNSPTSSHRPDFKRVYSFESIIILSECLAKGKVALSYIRRVPGDGESCTKSLLRPRPRIAAFVGEKLRMYLLLSRLHTRQSIFQEEIWRVILELYQTTQTFKCLVCLSCDSFFHLCGRDSADPRVDS
ncbi:hypothetical protein GBAR_LOCUS13519, partial [Geodia barretti]